jgi:hypothetical protein
MSLEIALCKLYVRGQEKLKYMLKNGQLSKLKRLEKVRCVMFSEWLSLSKGTIYFDAINGASNQSDNKVTSRKHNFSLFR